MSETNHEAGNEMQEIVRRALRQTPERIIVGELRDASAFDLLQAMNTGHDGTAATVGWGVSELAQMRFLHAFENADFDGDIIPIKASEIWPQSGAPELTGKRRVRA